MSERPSVHVGWGLRKWELYKAEQSETLTDFDSDPLHWEKQENHLFPDV